MQTLPYGAKILIDDEKLKTNHVINLINNKLTCCENFELCNNRFLKEEIDFEQKNSKLIRKDLIEIPELYWICPIQCEHYRKKLKDEEDFLFFSRDEYHSVDQEVDAMTDKAVFAFFSELLFGKQSYEKYGGVNVEESCHTTVSDRRTKRGRLNRDKK